MPFRENAHDSNGLTPDRGATRQGERGTFLANSSAKQRFCVLLSSKTPSKSEPNSEESGNCRFRDEFAVDCPLHQRVYCEPDFVDHGWRRRAERGVKRMLRPPCPRSKHHLPDFDGGSGCAC